MSNDKKQTDNLIVEQILNNLPELPSMPAIVAQALNLIDDPNTEVKQLADVLSKDISMTTQILKLVNSAYYGFPAQITSINKAMALLGFDKIRTLILSVAVKPMMMSYSGKALWNHSIRCAVGAHHISKSLNYGDPDEAFVMGLLHDIGRTVMQIYNKNAYSEIDKLVAIGADVLEAERTFYGFTHTEMGKALVQKWKLPLIIGIAAQHHHNPLEAEETVSASIVYVANQITQEQLKYPVFNNEIIDSFDYEIQNPDALREEIFELSKPIIEVLS
ncbi:MAG TPA: HDOD domain-containing protein [Candidatus Gastranaerophilales bacterium]|nr:HDOD domain-containing protein [Candidatus Gastranaerophilales bacterium]